MNYRVVCNILGKVLLAEAILLLLPMGTALWYRESALPFLWTMLPLILLGGALSAIKPKSGSLFAREGFVVVGLSWVLMSAFGALPFVWSGAIPHLVDAYFEAVSGFNMTPEQKARVRIVQGHFADIDLRIAQLDEIIGNLVSEYESQISLLCTIPGIDRRIAITILSEIGADMTEFGSSKRLCNWAGLAPASNQSAGKKKSVRISRAGVYLKPALVEAAHAAVKSTEKQPYYRIKFERLMKRRGKKRATIAIARMILTAIYAMLSTGEVFAPSDLEKYDMPEDLKKKQTISSAKEAVKLLVSLGLITEGSISLEALAS